MPKFVMTGNIRMAKLLQYMGILAVCFFFTEATAQQSCLLIIHPVDQPGKVARETQSPQSFSSKEKCLAYVQQLPAALQAKGFISASVDSVWEDSASVSILLFTGKQYRWDSLTVDAKDWPLLNSLGYTRSMFSSKPFDQQQVDRLYTSLLDYHANNGYPFVSIRLDSTVIEEDRLKARLTLDRGALYYLDTIILVGSIKLSKSFITRYLGIMEHSPYSQEKLDKIDSRLAELPFLLQSQPHRVNMLNTGAELNLFLQNRRSNQVNVLVGFLPANPQVGGKLLVTGEANLNLRNSFGNGETLALNWQQFLARSPRLNLLFQQPYLFNSPVGMNASFELYKRDTFFLNLRAQAGALLNISARQVLQLSLQFAGTNALYTDTNTVKQTKQLPAVSDLSTLSVALQYTYNNTDYRFNPRKGNDLLLGVSFGRKKIEENNAILQISDPSFDYSSLYDTVQLSSYVFRFNLSAAHYFPLGRQATIKTALVAGWLQTPNYYVNELFQIGGFKYLRGFDEESIFTNRFAIGTLEYRYLLGRNSWLYAFTDLAHAVQQSVSYNYLGFGGGLAFETNSGVFNLAWAVGKRDDQSLDFRQSKIHIGFVSLF